MSITVDHFIKTGSSHNICEDYIISGQTPAPHVILADGCSASDQTEMGSRILVYLSKQFLKYRKDCLDKIDYFEMGNWVIQNAENVVRRLGLGRTCLDATLIVSYLSGNRIFVHMYGDGFIIHRRPGEDIWILNVSFTGNAPYYLSYRLDPGRALLYHEKQYHMNIGNQPRPCDAPVSLNFPIEADATLLVASDGIDSFIDDCGRKKNYHDYLCEFTEFKNFKGEFLKRRMKKAIKTLERKGFTHYDDISAGAFLIKPEFGINPTGG